MPRSRRPSPAQTMRRLLTSYWVPQLLLVVARLGVADILARGPLTAAAIAARTGVHPQFLHRVLRALASQGVFAEGSGGRFRLTPLGRTLRGSEPGSMRNFALMIVDDYNWQSWGHLEECVRTGRTAFDEVHGMPIFQYLMQHPDKERTFAASMASISGMENSAVAKAWPFGSLRRLVDVGGAHGHLLATILRRHRRLRGVLYDQPQVAESAPQSGFVTAKGIADRCDVVGGDFFASVPAGADAYIMKYIIHDWDDDKCLRILRNCRKAMAPGGRVLVVEHVIPPGNSADWSKLLDINMMVLPGGRERTRDEFRRLFAAAGLRLKRVIPTECPLRILEAVAARD